MIDIAFAILFTKAKIIQFDVFSGPAFRITEIGSSLAKLRNKKTILTLHGGALPEFTLKNVARVKSTLSKAHVIQSPSLFLIDFFKGVDIDVEYLPNPLELQNFKYKREVINPHSLLWVRAFTDIYNPHIPVQTLYELRQTYPDATLTMVGPDKGLLSETEALIQKLNLTNSVTITGPIKNEELYTYYQNHAVYLNTTSYESFGVAVFEAASCGTPIVSSKVGEIPYLWKHEENALLVEDLSGKMFAEQISKIFESKELSERLSKNARQKSEEFAWEKIKPLWLSVLQRKDDIK
jgi:L-malate glycosyltransferase